MRQILVNRYTANVFNRLNGTLYINRRKFMQVLTTQKICFRCQMILVSPVDKTLERISSYGFLRRSLAHGNFLPLPWAQVYQSIIVLASVLLLHLITLLRWLERPKISHASTVKLGLLLLWLVKGALGSSWLELGLPLRLLLLLHCLLGAILLAHARAHPKLLVLLLL